MIADQDILLTRLQAKVQVQVRMSSELTHHLPESSSAQTTDTQNCSWKLFKTFNSQGIGISQVETQQLDQMVSLYQKPVFKIHYLDYR